MSQNVRPEKVRKAAQYICSNSKLFIEHGIEYDPAWDITDTQSNEDNTDIPVNIVILLLLKKIIYKQFLKLLIYLFVC